MSYIYVKYTGFGDDHSGYCSGNDAGDPDEFPDRWVIMRRPAEWKATHCMDQDEKATLCRDELSYSNDGCTAVDAGGSGYCKGFYQQWTCIDWHDVYLKDDTLIEVPCACSQCIRRYKPLNISMDPPPRSDPPPQSESMESTVSSIYKDTETWYANMFRELVINNGLSTPPYIATFDTSYFDKYENSKLVERNFMRYAEKFVHIVQNNSVSYLAYLKDEPPRGSWIAGIPKRSGDDDLNCEPRDRWIPGRGYY